ncbi:hypothetical protein POM88_028295 [Heracleum sosnowskyi]|uniref:Uncharacterized protein n=1 Tax=Heracleum sosnowskyi TaxID=360622 RepID=A0AAD8IAM9_9APIA|nr:hypothetical protein POM88_028295 [Heracleum sosnowskyi]
MHSQQVFIRTAGSSLLHMKKDPRERSFRNEDYNIRRVFLRSYPLQWGGDDEVKIEANKKESTRVRMSRGKVKKMIIAVVHCGEDRNLVFSRPLQLRNIPGGDHQGE